MWIAGLVIRQSVWLANGCCLYRRADRGCGIHAAAGSVRTLASYLRPPSCSDIRWAAAAPVLRAVSSCALLPDEGGLCSPRSDHSVQVSAFTNSFSIHDLSTARVSATSMSSSRLYAHGVRVPARLRHSALIAVLSFS